MRWDGHRLFGRPPVLAPPAWAAAARLWESLDLPLSAERGVTPSEWCAAAAGAVPCNTRAFVLVVPDATRVGPWRDALPNLLVSFEHALPAGASRRLLIATGTHAPVGTAAIAAHLGLEASLLSRWETIENSAEHFTTHREVGSTRAGTSVRLHPAYLDADWRVTLGSTSYHYFAGFGAGPKLVFPGCAEPLGAAMNHRRAVEAREESDWPWRLHPRATAGEVDGNPVHDDIGDAYALAPAHWSISIDAVPPLEVDPARPAAPPLVVEQGEGLAAWRRAIERHDAAHRVPFTQRPKLLILDAGGTPRDHTLLQAQKSLQHALRFTDEGAAILLAAGLGGGLGSEALRLFAREGTALPRAELALDRPAGLHVQTLTSLRQATTHRSVGLWSELDPTEARALGMEPLTSEAEAIDFCRRMGGDRHWGFLPRAELFLPARGWLGGRAPGARE